MRVLRSGLVALLVGMAVAIGLAVPAHASDPVQPPRTAGGSTVAYDAAKEYVIPCLSIGTCQDYFGMQQDSLWGPMFRAIHSARCAPYDGGNLWHVITAHDPSEDQACAPQREGSSYKLSDAQWCQIDIRCSGNVPGAQPIGALGFGTVTLKDPILSGDSNVTFGLRTFAWGPYCNSLSEAQKPTKCKVAQGPWAAGVKVVDAFALVGRYGGMCENKLNGQRQGLVGTATQPNNGIGYMRTGLSMNPGPDGQNTNDVLWQWGGTTAGFPVCASGYVLKWMRWENASTGFTTNGAHLETGSWVAPSYTSAPETTITANLTCYARGDLTTAYSYTKTGPAGTGDIPLLSCPAGQIPGGGSTVVNTPLGSPLTVNNWTITQTARDQYPECLGATALGCRMVVKVDGSPCYPGREACQDWYGLWQRYPSRVGCFWGPYAMSPNPDCLSLRYAYWSETGVVSDPKVPGGTKPVTTEGTPIPTQQQPTTGPGPLPETPEAEQCWPSGLSGLNPLAWVLEPLKCAAGWAFQPDLPAINFQVEGLKEQIESKGVGPAFDSLESTFGAVEAAAAGSGCEGPTLEFDVKGIVQTVQPFNACTGVMATLAGMTHAFTTLVVVVGGIIGIARALASGFGLSFSFGRGGGGDS